MEGEQLAGADEQSLAVRGERDPAGGAGEQAHPQLPLEAGDVAAESLLGQVQPGGGPGEVQLLGDRHEVAQQAQVELVRHVPAPPLDRLTL